MLQSSSLPKSIIIVHTSKVSWKKQRSARGLFIFILKNQGRSLYCRAGKIIFGLGRICPS
jgi:hypothetical protein